MGGNPLPEVPRLIAYPSPLSLEKTVVALRRVAIEALLAAAKKAPAANKREWTVREWMERDLQKAESMLEAYLSAGITGLKNPDDPPLAVHALGKELPTVYPTFKEASEGSNVLSALAAGIDRAEGLLLGTQKVMRADAFGAALPASHKALFLNVTPGNFFGTRIDTSNLAVIPRGGSPMPALLSAYFFGPAVVQYWRMVIFIRARLIAAVLQAWAVIPDGGEKLVRPVKNEKKKPNNGNGFVRLWDEVDGRAGFWFSSRATELSESFLSFPSMKRLMSRDVEADSGVRFYGEALRGIASSLSTASRRAREWRSWPHNSTADVTELGVLHPAAFPRVAADVLGREPRHCDHARPAAVDRLRLLKRLWVGASENLLRNGMIPSAMNQGPGSIPFLFTAGSLPEGGNHPPHMSHRNGASFDVDVAKMPVMEPILFMWPEDFSLNSGPPLDMGGIIYDFDPEQEVADFSVEPTNLAEVRDFDFRGPDREKLRAIAIKFTECVYLTLPETSIWASEFMNRTAQKNLLARIDRAITALDRSGATEKPDSHESAQKEVLQKMIPLISRINPVPWLGASHAAMLKMRFSHHDHWHVNYGPESLGDEGAAKARPHKRLGDLTRLNNEAIDGMNRLDLWDTLLGPIEGHDARQLGQSL